MKALITRPAEDAAPLARALAARGVASMLAPMLAIHPLPEAAQRLADALIGAQALLFTSANGARVFAAASARRELPVLAVGDASAAAARIANFRSVMSAGGDVEDLARLAAARLAPGHGPLVHVAGREVAGDLSGLLAERGFTVRRAVIYAAEPAAALPEEAAAALRSGALDFALFFSPRSAGQFVRLAAAAGLAPFCRRVGALALSPAVADALAALPWRRIVIAAAPNQPALLSALDAVLAAEKQAKEPHEP
jgi:uroporphyrinogen-III synthase